MPRFPLKTALAAVACAAALAVPAAVLAWGNTGHRMIGMVAVMSLPAKDRETVVLHYYQGFALTEIAKLTGVPASTVRARLARAKKKLQRKLEGWYYDE